MSRKSRNWVLSIILSFLFLLTACVVSLISGSAGISLSDTIHALVSGKGPAEHSILFDIRLPRIILALAIGGGLSIAGVILQGMFRNPLVEPYTLGISGGAALGASICIIFKLHLLLPDLALPLSGFVGACLVVLPVYYLNARRRVLKIEELLLTGVMTSLISSSLVILILAVARTEELHSIVFWTMGSLEEPSWALIMTALFSSFFCLVISYFYSLDMNALSLGEEEAIHLGVNTERMKRRLFLLASLLSGISVSVAGIIGFVGLIVPHFVRMLVGYDHRILLIVSFLSGAGFLIFCDTIARTVIAPVELPVGVITGILGGIIFVYALSRRFSSGRTGGS